MRKIEPTPVQKYAFKWADLHAEKLHLTDLLKQEVNEEQEDFIGEYIHSICERIEELEFDILEDGKEFYQEVRNMADMINIKPSTEFLARLDDNLSEMDLDGTDYQVKKAVEKFNSFYYSCSIIVNSFGYVSFMGCASENNGSSTVLFNGEAGRRYKVTVEDVKRKLIV